jgi:hypothetical protein
VKHAVAGNRDGAGRIAVCIPAEPTHRVTAHR